MGKHVKAYYSIHDCTIHLRRGCFIVPQVLSILHELVHHLIFVCFFYPKGFDYEYNASSKYIGIYGTRHFHGIYCHIRFDWLWWNLFNIFNNLRKEHNGSLLSRAVNYDDFLKGKAGL